MSYAKPSLTEMATGIEQACCTFSIKVGPVAIFADCNLPELPSM